MSATLPLASFDPAPQYSCAGVHFDVTEVEKWRKSAIFDRSTRARRIPRVVDAGRPAGRCHPALACPGGVPELLGGHLQVVLLAEVPRVAVHLQAAERQRRYVVDGCRLPGAALIEAHLAQAVGAP